MVQVTSYDSTSTTTTTSSNSTTTNNNVTAPSEPTSSPQQQLATRSSRDVLASEIRALESSLQAIHRLTSTPTPESSFPRIPDELIRYVDGGRNPDIYTRQFVEMIRRSNQVIKGKQAAFRSFRDVLAGEMDKAMPELRDDVAAVLKATDGTRTA